MQILWDHTFGKQENQDLVICKPMAIVDHTEEEEALETGWLALDEPVDNKEVFHLNYPYKSGITSPLKKHLHSTSSYVKKKFNLLLVI